VNRLIWTDTARAGLADLLDPFLADRPDFIASAMQQVARLERLLIDSPGIGVRFDEDGQRKLRVGRTPIILFYRVDGSQISIVRVRHSASDWRQ
jgi:toxin ParE1/3/4